MYEHNRMLLGVLLLPLVFAVVLTVVQFLPRFLSYPVSDF